MDKRRTVDIRKEACGEMCRKERMAAENGDRTVIGQIHWKGRAYPVREIDAGSSTFRVSVESLRDELITDMRSGIYEAMEVCEEIDGFCTGEELRTLPDAELYRMYC